MIFESITARELALARREDALKRQEAMLMALERDEAMARATHAHSARYLFEREMILKQREDALALKEEALNVRDAALEARERNMLLSEEELERKHLRAAWQKGGARRRLNLEDGGEAKGLCAIFCFVVLVLADVLPSLLCRLTAKCCRGDPGVGLGERG